MNRNDQVTAIAEAFAETLAQMLSKDEFAEMKHRNENNRAYHDGVCASHDFCDANVPMGTAFKHIIGREPNSASDADAAIWNDAWSLARKLYLGIQ